MKSGLIFSVDYRKIPKISPKALFEGLTYEGNLCLKINWASFIVGSKFIIFVLFYFVFEGSFFKYKPPGGLYLEG